MNQSLVSLLVSINIYTVETSVTLLDTIDCFVYTFNTKKRNAPEITFLNQMVELFGIVSFGLQT